ncbi:N-glycosylase/DNA lyase [Hippea jasoniae]|uniref:N-glycosylase/DNA lyase n=1 Tax=Hippea jasoniae TaxID=944479 RepID=UPI0005594768|nr:N-glycosylase/DNA lyase [Hippea jasoniae]
MDLDLIKNTLKQIKDKIEQKKLEFQQTFNSPHKVFKELVFCLLTPQSKAEKAWDIVEYLDQNGLLYSADKDLLAEVFKNVRFRFHKAEYVVLAQKQFIKNNTPTIKELIEQFKNPIQCRNFLVKNVKGMGYKEASHFLRNIYIGNNLAILDRHILRSLNELGVVEKIPSSLSAKKYLEIEQKLVNYCKSIDIEPFYFDFILWQINTGRIFK